METVMEEGDCLSQEEESAWNDRLDILQLCRICANPNDYLIPIFKGEGLEHELEEKIAKHLPIKVTQNDELPTKLCYQCASILIAWHDMVVGCEEADEKLRAVRSCRSGNQTKVSHEVIIKEILAESNGNSEPNKVLSPMNVSQDEDPKLITSVDMENVIEEEEIASVKPEIMQDATLDTRCLGSFKAYQQTQVALRMLQWAKRGSVFCIICGEKRENQMVLIRHIYIDHNMQCGAKFTNELILLYRMLSHDKEICQAKTSLKKPNKTNHCSNYEHFYDESCRNEDKERCDASMFKCEICSVSFLRRFDLKNHQIKVHSNLNLDSNKENGSCNIKGKKKGKSIQPEIKFRSLIQAEQVVSENETHYLSDCESSIKQELVEDLFVKPEVTLFEPKFSCTSCNYSCDIKREFLLHKRNIHNLHWSDKTCIRRKKAHYCEICNNSYIRKADLQRHIVKVHTNQEFSTRKIDLAGDDVNVHIIDQAKEKINGVIVYRCEVCAKNLRSKKGFVRHLRVHSGERPYTCHICGKQYRSNTDLSRHLKCVHEGIKKYQCDICSQFFANKATKNDHRRIHTGEKPFMCDICGKSFPTRNSIYIHRRIHTNYFPHECNTCEKKFRRKQQLIHHTRTHTGEKPYACDVCGKCFAVKDEVTRHKLTHSNEKPHICQSCGFGFAQKRYLMHHIKTHHPGLM